MLSHYVNSQSIPVEIGIVFRENAKIPETGTTDRVGVLAI